MGKGIEQMAARDTLVEQVESILWKYVYDVLPKQDIEECLATALTNHIASLKAVGISLPANK